MKLYRCSKDQTRWFACSPETGWFMFPAEIDGWTKRKPSTGIDPTTMHEVPVRMGFNTGIPGAPMSSRLFLVPKSRQLRPIPHCGGM